MFCPSFSLSFQILQSLLDRLQIQTEAETEVGPTDSSIELVQVDEMKVEEKAATVSVKAEAEIAKTEAVQPNEEDEKWFESIFS